MCWWVIVQFWWPGPVLPQQPNDFVLCESCGQKYFLHRMNVVICGSAPLPWINCRSRSCHSFVQQVGKFPRTISSPKHQIATPPHPPQPEDFIKWHQAQFCVRIQISCEKETNLDMSPAWCVLSINLWTPPPKKKRKQSLSPPCW